MIALLIGATGMGIASLLTSTLDLVNTFSGFGIDKSAVRDISLSKESKNVDNIYKTLGVLKKLIWLTAFFGGLILIIFSPWLSELAFGNEDYTFAFIWLSIAILFKQLTNGEIVALQGLRHLKALAASNIVGNFMSLVVTLPLYYLFGLDGIVPAIILSSVVAFFITLYFSYKKYETLNVDNNFAILQAKSMLSLGITLSFSSLISIIQAYILRIYISSQSGLMEVGLYTAGFMILNTYVGLIFTAMGTDYFPRLSAVSEQLDKIRKVVFEQSIIAILLLLPIIVIFLALAPFIIRLLYSSEFDSILMMVSWGILGMVFRAVSFSIGYTIIAKGHSKVFMVTAIVFNLILLIVNIIGYHFMGLTGLGISFFVYYIIHFLSLKVLVKRLYNLSLNKELYIKFILAVTFCLTTFACTFIDNLYLKYSLLFLLIILSLLYSYSELNKKMNVKDAILQLFKKKK